MAADDDPARQSSLESTADLLVQMRGGDEKATGRLFHIFAPILRQWARGRLPQYARGLADTEDLVQITLIRVFDRIEGIELHGPGSFLAYLRRSLLNNLRNEIRRSMRRPAGSPAKGELPDDTASPLEQAVGKRALAAYEEALERLEEEQRAAVILRIEFGFKHREIAEMLEKPSANAARMLVSRSLMRLSDLIDEEALRDGSEGR